MFKADSAYQLRAVLKLPLLHAANSGVRVAAVKVDGGSSNGCIGMEESAASRAGRIDIVIMVMRPSETIVLYDGIHVFCTDGSTFIR